VTNVMFDYISFEVRRLNVMLLNLAELKTCWCLCEIKGHRLHTHVQGSQFYAGHRICSWMAEFAICCWIFTFMSN